MADVAPENFDAYDHLAVIVHRSNNVIKIAEALINGARIDPRELARASLHLNIMINQLLKGIAPPPDAPPHQPDVAAVMAQNGAGAVQ
jgi:hypothetical protein